MNKVKEKNVNYILIGSFFIGLTTVITSFFLSYYLKEEGMTILQIGSIFTIGLALGHLIMSILFSFILRKIEIKNGLRLAGIFSFLTSFILLMFTNAFGVLLSQLCGKAKNVFYGVSNDVGLQHNTGKNKIKTATYSLITESLSFTFGIILSIILIKQIGFIYSFGIFAIFAVVGILIYGKINDRYRFKLKSNKNIGKIPYILKIFLIGEIVYQLALSSSFALVITFLVTDKFSGSFEWIGYLFLALYIPMGIASFVVRKYVEKKDHIKITIFGMFILMMSAIIIIFSNNLYIVLIAMLLEGIGAGIWVPSKNSFYWKFTKPEIREKVSGRLIGWKGLSATIGPLFGAMLVTNFNILTPFYFKAVISFASICIYLYVMKKSKFNN